MIRSHALALFTVVTLAAACGGSHTRSAQSASAAKHRGLATQYLAIAKVGNEGLDRAFEALDGADHDHLAAARADLRAAAAAEREFDRSLLGIVFPSAIEAAAHAVVRVNEARADLTSQAAASPSLQELRRFDPRLAAANDAVVQQVRNLREQLGLPPAPTS